MSTQQSSSASSSSMLAGDDVGAIVIDIGGHTSRIGYAGEDCPKQVCNSCAGRSLLLPDDCASNEIIFPLCFLTKREAVEVKPCIYSRGKQKYLNEDVFETLISKTCEGVSYKERTNFFLKSRENNTESNDTTQYNNMRHRFGSLGVDLREHPVLLTEPTKHCRLLREKMIEILFEKFDVPATYLSKQAVLSAFAVGRASGLIVDIGANGTCLSHLTDGFVLQKSVVDFPIGGDCLDMQFSHLLAERQLAIYPLYAVKKVLKDPGSGFGNITDIIKIDITKVHSTYLQYSQYETVRKLKEAICRVAEDKLDIINAQMNDNRNNNNMLNSQYSPSFIQHVNNVQYKELPDGTKLNVESYMHKVPEILFTPSLLKCSNENFLRGFKGLPAAIADSIHKCDVDLRRDLLNAIILTGGCSLIPGLSDRLSRELQQNEKSLGAAIRFRVVSPTCLERRFSSWIGGSILASLGTFQQMWLSNEEYKEHGTLIAERKCA